LFPSCCEPEHLSFRKAAGRYAQTTGNLDTFDRTLAWIDGPGDRDHDGFVEYFKATGPIALAEVQRYVYAAKQLASCWADQLGFTDRARRLVSDGGEHFFQRTRPRILSTSSTTRPAKP
jgi:hypothetical protein